MCETIITYTCHHRGYETTPCQAYTKRLRAAQLSPPRSSFWRTFFCGASSPSTIQCNQNPGKRTIFTKRPSCVSAESYHLALKARETEMRVQKARESHNAAEKMRMEERRKSDRKAAFRCSECAAERRRPDQMTRAANGGLCCARGLEEFEELERNKGNVLSSSSKKRTPVPTYANAPAQTTSTREQRFPELRYMTSTEKARDDAKVAANTYGWDRTRKGSVSLEPGLVTGYVNQAGAGTNSLNTAPVPAKPNYEDLGIDFTLWRQMQDVKLGTHGRIPPPPEKPLPVRPLQIKQKNHQVPRKPIGSAAPVSPLSPKSKQVYRSNVSVMNGELNGMIDDAMLEFQPSPQPRYRY